MHKIIRAKLECVENIHSNELEINQCVRIVPYTGRDRLNKTNTTHNCICPISEYFATGLKSELLISFTDKKPVLCAALREKTVFLFVNMKSLHFTIVSPPIYIYTFF